MREAMHYRKRDDAKVQCLLCPHHCLIEPGSTGRCGVRENRNGTLFSLNYARITSAAMDPIEKKPLYHFFPGRDILSLGTFGCNFRCPFCQNWRISQQKPPTEEMSPDQAVALARRYRSVGIAYTYNEPIIWYEFVLDTARKARQEGLKNVQVAEAAVRSSRLHQPVEIAAV